MSAPIELIEGSTLTDGTEQDIEVINTAGIYTLVLDTTNMVSGDSIILKVYRAVVSGGPAVLAGSITYTDAQDVPVKFFGPFTLTRISAVWDMTFSIQSLAGTDETYAWSVESL